MLMAEKARLEKGQMKEPVFLEKKRREDFEKPIIEGLIRTIEAGNKQIDEEKDKNQGQATQEIVQNRCDAKKTEIQLIQDMISQLSDIQ